MIKFIHHCLAYFKKTSSKPVTAINSLAPKILTLPEDLLRVQPYLNALKKTIDDPDITNIALTGGYGSGKSTIIKTFRSQYTQYDYLNLSLASFKNIKDEKGEPDKDKKFDRQLEVSILQQIFYHVRPSDIPDSRFKRIVNITTGKIWFFAVSLVLWVASTLIIFQSGYISKMNPQTWDIKKEFDFFAPLPFIIFFIGVGLFAKTVIRLFSNSKISKFTIKGELELGDNIDKSVFNEHLEEIIYFFERTPYNVVIIEDLDRFESTDIFTKLREINILLNKSIPVGREINFVYAIKDEMFTDKSERVKFFEYIIPVIPFINPSNAGDQMTRLIKDASLEWVLSKEFTEDVVTFIDDIDMRLLTNIFHEYQLYRSNLNDDLNQDELFAMITYKNLFPDDFGELHKRRGKLYKFISGKQNYIEQLLLEHNKEITNLERQIANIENERIDEFLELQKIYVLEYFKLIPDAVTFVVDGQQRKIADLIEEEVFEKLKDLTTVNYYYYYSQYGTIYFKSTNTTLPFSKIENAVNENFTYDERVEFINNRIDNKQSLHKTEIQKLKGAIMDVESWSLKKIFEVVNIDPYLGDFSENYLIRNLLLNGYLNENYNDYISLFHAVNLTKEDNTFIRNVKSGVSTPYDYKLTRLENLYTRISPKYFSRQAVLNFDLMDYMAVNYGTLKDSYDSVIRQLYTAKEKQTAFIDAYLDKRQIHSALFINSICKEWKGFWDDIVQKGNFTAEKKDKYLLLILNNADLSDILNLGVNIKSYVEKHENVLELLQHTAISKAKEILTMLNVKLEYLPEPSAQSNELFDHVYKSSLYRINAANIAAVVRNKELDINEQELNKANYTTVFGSNCTELITYLKANIENYVKVVVLRAGNNEESESSLIALLNDEKITDGTKITLINYQMTVIDNITDITSQTIREELIADNKIKVNWENLLTYFEGLKPKELDQMLIDFLNQPKVYELLSAQNIVKVKSHNENIIKTFFVKILYCNELLYNTYTSLLNSYKGRWGNLKFEHLEKDKVKYLTEKSFLSFEVHNYENLREHFSSEGYHITFLEDNQSEFFEKINEITIEENEISKLLQSSKLTLEAKAKLIEHVKDTDENLIINNILIGRLTCNVLSQTSNMQISLAMLQSLFENSSSNEDRIRLLNKQVDHCSDSDLQELISRLGHDYKDIFKKQHKPSFLITEYHQHLFSVLKERKLIKSFDKDAKNEGKYRLIANYQ